MPILKCQETVFYSQLDETMFFAALQRISAVQKITGSGADLFVTVASRPSDKALRELLGLFHRYQVDLRQLAQFATKKNHVWFRASNAYWSKAVFSTRR